MKKLIGSFLCLMIFTSIVVAAEVKTDNSLTQSEKTYRYYNEKKEPLTALALSAVLLGAGQAYNGNWGKAGLIYLIYFVDVAILINVNSVNAAYTVALTLIPATYLYGLYDAYTDAERINKDLKLKYGVSAKPLFDCTLNKLL